MAAPPSFRRKKQHIKYADSQLIRATSMITNYDKVQTKGRLGLIKDTKEIIAFAELMISFFDSVAEHLWCRQRKVTQRFLCHYSVFGFFP